MRVTVIEVIFVEIISKPCRIAIVMFIKQFYGSFTVPLWIVCTPCCDISNQMHLRIFSKDGLAKLHITVIIMIALLSAIRLVILISYLEVLYIKRCRMSIIGTHLSIFSRDITICIFQCLHTFINPWLNAVHRCQSTVPKAYINYI